MDHRGLGQSPNCAPCLNKSGAFLGWYVGLINNDCNHNLSIRTEQEIGP